MKRQGEREASDTDSYYRIRLKSVLANLLPSFVSCFLRFASDLSDPHQRAQRIFPSHLRTCKTWLVYCWLRQFHCCYMAPFISSRFRASGSKTYISSAQPLGFPPRTVDWCLQVIRDLKPITHEANCNKWGKKNSVQFDCVCGRVQTCSGHFGLQRAISYFALTPATRQFFLFQLPYNW